MARHYLAQGGNSRDTYCMGDGLFPSTPYAPDQNVLPEARRTSIDFAITRCLDFGCGDSPCAGCVTAECKGSTALREYLDKFTIAVGDTIDVAYLPRKTTLQEIYYSIESPITPFTFNIQVADYNGAAAPLVLATGVSGAAIDWQVLNVFTINGNAPLEIRTNGVLQIAVTALPPLLPAQTACGCGGCGGICGLSMKIAPVIRRYETGCF